MDISLKGPLVQVALDFPTAEKAIEVAAVAVEAGVDWLEIGTPLIVEQGIEPIGKMVKAFPDYPVLADYKTMDSGFANVLRTQKQGGHIMTVCANSPDETVQSAINEGKKTGILVCVDTIGASDVPARARQCQDWGADMIYLHYGADQRRSDDSNDSVQWLESVMEVVSIPIGVGTFDVKDGVEAMKGGADLVCIGHPIFESDDLLGALKEYVDAVKSNHQPRR